MINTILTLFSCFAKLPCYYHHPYHQIQVYYLIYIEIVAFESEVLVKNKMEIDGRFDFP